MESIKEEKEDINSNFKQQFEELQSIINFKENEIKTVTKKYHQSLAKKRIIDVDMQEAQKQIKFLLENDGKCRDIINQQKDQILALDRKRKGEYNYPQDD